MKRAARAWLVFAAGNLVVAAALAWTTAVVFRLERSELRARAETDYQESLRLALWRMDSWLSLFLAKEAARPSTDETPDSELVPLRFEVDGRGVVTARGVERLVAYVGLDTLRAALRRADAMLGATQGSAARTDDKATWYDVQILKSQNEYDARVACATPGPPGADPATRQTVAWLDAPAPPAAPVLVFLRRAVADGEEKFSGFVIDWPGLRERLLSEIRDLIPSADLGPEPTVAAAAGARELGLANAPVALRAPRPSAAAAPGITAVRAALAVAWIAAIGGMAAVGLTLRKSIDLGERRRRFVSAVTHEMRTPLTTFQMYSEMLADGIVRDDEQRRLYMKTLKEESRRLSATVANVLSHARLEERRGPRPVESLSLESLIDRVRPPLGRRAESSGTTLDVQTAGPAAPLMVDVDAIGQILANLVDNAAKYASGGKRNAIELMAAVDNGSLVMTVRDHGPGVPSAQARAIFAPFERGGRDAADPVPGVGLGLAISRGLARDMGGDLTLDAPDGGGATFRLVLPTRSI